MPSGSEVKILVVDDEAVVRESLAAWFRDEGYEVGTASGGKEALDALARTEWDVFLLDIKMPGMDGLELQRRILEHRPEASIIVMTAYATVDTAVEALKQGAHDYLSKPFDPADLARIVRSAAERKRLVRENQRLREAAEDATPAVDVIGRSPAMRRVLELVKQVAPTDATVLIRGESGTGKEVIARAIHAGSPRRYLPIIVVNCGALPEGVLESELFGHERGAFTGAQYRRKGRIEMSDGGTLFLDEIGDVSPKTQLDLLRVLEEKTITRIGANKMVPVDFRTVAATNRDLEALVTAGTFREDLYYRLNVFSITIPPLRERTEDIPPLAEHFVRKFSRSMNRLSRGLSPDAMGLLMAHPWPGNVRELQNAIERALVVSRGEVLVPADFPMLSAPHLQTPGATRGQVCQATTEVPAPADGSNGSPMNDGDKHPHAEGRSLAEIEAEHVRRTLNETGFNITLAARVLGIDRVTLYNKMRRYDIHRPDHGRAHAANGSH